MEDERMDHQDSQEHLSEKDMITQHDIQTISNLPIEQVAEALGLATKRHWTLCPYHGDSHPSMRFYTGNNRFYCYVCQQHGGPIDLVMRVQNLSFVDAVGWLSQSFGIILSEPLSARHFANVTPRQVKPVAKEAERPIDRRHLAQLVAQPTLTAEARRFLFDERKLDPKVIESCGISSSHTHLLIPYFDANGRFVSVQWRALHADKTSPNRQPRFLFPKGCSCNIYNLQVLRQLNTAEPLFVCEGASDCWSMLSSGHKAIAIPSATLLKPADVDLLTSICSHRSTSFHMFPDADEPGERLFLELQKLLPSIVRHQLPEDCKDFSDYYVKARTKS